MLHMVWVTNNFRLFRPSCCRPSREESISVQVAAAAQQAGQAASEAGAYAEEQLSKVPGFKVKTEGALRKERRIWKALLIAGSAAGTLLGFALL